MKRFNDFLLENKSTEIEEICKQYGIKKYDINTDGSVDVQGHVEISNNFKLYRLPLEFGKVSGFFISYRMGLTTLEGCPKEIGWDFSCIDNFNLTSLEGLEDTIISGNIDIWRCTNLYSLDGFPIDFKGEFYCDGTPIEPIYDSYIKDTHFEGSNRLAQAIQFFNQLQVVEEGSFGWEISYRKLLEYLKRYKEFYKPSKELLQAIVGDKYIVR